MASAAAHLPASSELLQAVGISKRYGATQALRDVDFAARSGEVHAIVGENGAGKSTLVKVLTGAVAADSGRIVFDGTPRALGSPLAAQRLGIRVVHQHLNLVSHLSVTENILLGNLPGRRFWIDWSEAHRRAAQILRELGFPELDLKQPVARLTLARRKMVEIAKACRSEPRLLIMDEPSAALSHAERLRLFALVDKLKSQGTAVLYISHDLDEILKIADQVTVLRDGAVVGTLPCAQCSRRQLIEMMVGRVVGELYPQRADAPQQVRLQVRNLSASGRFSDVSLSIASGEIVGLYGLIGSGRSELARCLFGADPVDGGEVLIDGKPLRLRSPRAALNAGIALLTEDRSRDGLVQFLSVRDNVSLPNFSRMTRGGLIQRTRQQGLVETKVAEVDVRPHGIERLVRTLSGGNQQKVVLAKWLLAEARVLILDEPTWGVDVAAKHDIYRTVAKLVADGTSVLLISSELPEVLGLSDRIFVMRKGQLVGEFSRADASEAALLSLAVGQASPAQAA